MTNPRATFIAAARLPRVLCAGILSLTYVVPPRHDAVAHATVAALLLFSLVLGVVRMLEKKT
jgi:heme A synthase